MVKEVQQYSDLKFINYEYYTEPMKWKLAALQVMHISAAELTES